MIRKIFKLCDTVHGMHGPKMSNDYPLKAVKCCVWPTNKLLEYVFRTLKKKT